MQHPLKIAIRPQAVREIAGQALRYGLVGLLNTAVGVSTIFAMLAFTPAGPFLSNATGYGVSLTVSFFLNRSFTFKAADRGFPALKYLIAFAIAYGANVAALSVGLWAFKNPYLSQAPGIATYPIVFFLLARYYVFAAPQHERRTTAEPAE